MLLQRATWSQVETYLKSDNRVILPVGSTEQHGPTGLLGTDALLAEGVAQAAGEAAGVFVAPTVNVGMAQHHLAFPGSLTLQPSTLMAVMKDLFSSLTHHGFKRIMIVNGHGGNIPSLEAAASEFHAAGSLRHARDTTDVHIQVVNAWEGERALKLAADLFGERNGDHASAEELSIIRYLHPEAREHEAPEGWEWPGGEFKPFGSADHYRALYPDGVIGADIRLASEEAGEKLFEAAVADVVDLLQGKQNTG